MNSGRNFLQIAKREECTDRGGICRVSVHNFSHRCLPSVLVLSAASPLSPKKWDVVTISRTAGLHFPAMPGSGKQSDEVQQQIVEFLEAGIDPTTIHRRLKVGRSSIYRMKRCLQQHGTAYAPVETNKKNGRPKVMTMEQELVRPIIAAVFLSY